MYTYVLGSRSGKRGIVVEVKPCNRDWLYPLYIDSQSLNPLGSFDSVLFPVR
jgi:hypothetical protein